MGWSCS